MGRRSVHHKHHLLWDRLSPSHSPPLEEGLSAPQSSTEAPNTHLANPLLSDLLTTEAINLHTIFWTIPLTGSVKGHLLPGGKKKTTFKIVPQISVLGSTILPLKEKGLGDGVSLPELPWTTERAAYASLPQFWTREV